MNVNKVKLLQDKGVSKGAGLVEFASQEDADFAFKELNGVELDKRKICFTYSKAGNT